MQGLAGTWIRVVSWVLTIAALFFGIAPIPIQGSNSTPDASASLSPAPTLGALLPMTGFGSFTGVSQANAVGLVAEHVNGSGGIRETNLTLRVADTGSTTAGALDGAMRLIDDEGVQAIVGSAFSAETLAAFPFVESRGIAMISPSASHPRLTTADASDLLWRAIPSSALEGTAAATLAYENLNYRRVGVLARNDDYGRAVGSSFRENFTRLGGEISTVVLYDPSVTDFTSELTALFATNPEAVFLVSFPQDGQTILVNWWAGHDSWPTNWLTTDAMYDSQIFEDLRSAGVNTTGITGVTYGRSPAEMGMEAYERYRAAYAGRYGEEPPILSGNAYDAAFVIALAMHASGSTDPDVFGRALRYVANPPGRIILPGQWEAAISALKAGENIDYWGAANRIDFDANGDVGSAILAWRVNETGDLRDVLTLDEPVFWTPAPETPLPISVGITSPEAGRILSGSAMVRGRANAAAGVVRVEVRVDRGGWQIATGTTDWTFDIDTTALTDGAHSIGARSSDGWSYSEEATLDVIVDNTPASLTISDPRQGGFVAVSSFTASWTSSDAVSGIERIEIQLDADDPIPLPGSETEIRLGPIGEGPHTLLIRAFNGAGLVSDASVTFTADGTAPVTALGAAGTSGENGWYTSDVQVSLSSTDTGAGVGAISFRLNTEPWRTYQGSFAIADDGVHTISFNATDLVGNEETTGTAFVRIDGTPPLLQVDSVPEVSTRSDVTITWNASDATSGIARYEVSIDGGPFESTGTATTRRLTLPDGEHTIQVRAVDRAGHRSLDSVTIQIDTNVFSFSGPYGGAPTIGLPIAIGALVVGLLWRRVRAGRGRMGRP